MRRDDIIDRTSFTIHYFEMAYGNRIKGVSCNNEVHLSIALFLSVISIPVPGIL